MKIYIISILTILLAETAICQKIIEKNIAHKGQYVEVDVPFASHIEIKTWDKKMVYLKADISIYDRELLPLYKLNIAQNDSRITVKSDTEAIFEAFKEEWKKNGKKRYNYTSDLYDFNYVVYVPKNAQFKLKSINGAMESEIIEGHFTADLINGDIEIKKYSGTLDLSTVNGEIDLNVANTALKAETVNGSIYADEKLNLIAHEQHVGQKVESSIKSTSNSLRLNTINGNMYLRM